MRDFLNRHGAIIHTNNLQETGSESWTNLIAFSSTYHYRRMLHVIECVNYKSSVIMKRSNLGYIPNVLDI